jgi:hypothetical protein
MSIENIDICVVLNEKGVPSNPLIAWVITS